MIIFLLLPVVGIALMKWIFQTIAHMYFIRDCATIEEQTNHWVRIWNLLVRLSMRHCEKMLRDNNFSKAEHTATPTLLLSLLNANKRKNKLIWRLTNKLNLMASIVIICMVIKKLQEWNMNRQHCKYTCYPISLHRQHGNPTLYVSMN